MRTELLQFLGFCLHFFFSSSPTLLLCFIVVVVVVVSVIDISTIERLRKLFVRTQGQLLGELTEPLQIHPSARPLGIFHILLYKRVFIH